MKCQFSALIMGKCYTVYEVSNHGIMQVKELQLVAGAVVVEGTTRYGGETFKYGFEPSDVKPLPPQRPGDMTVPEAEQVIEYAAAVRTENVLAAQGRDPFLKLGLDAEQATRAINNLRAAMRKIGMLG